MIELLKNKLSKTYQLGVYAGICAFAALSVSSSAFAHCHHDHSENDLELGVALETDFWILVQNQQLKKYSEKLAIIFQGLSESGIYSRKQQIDGLKGVFIPEFSIDNPKVLRDEDTLVLSYDFVAIGSGLTSGPSISVWKQYDHTWKIVSHSYVNFLE